MKLIIRYIEAKGVGKETHDVTFEGERATIGRGTDQSIQISDRRIPLAHSVLTVNGQNLWLKAESGHSFTVNDHVSRNSALNEGDVVDVLGHQIRVLPGSDSAEYIVEVTIEESHVEPLRDRFTTRLRELSYPQRKLSWLFFVLILAIGAGIPAIGFFVGMDVLRDSPLPDDSQWLAGELHHTHAFTGDECNFCHTIPFVQVRDQDCLTCHQTVNHHFDTNFHGADDTSGNQCEDCHKEHSGPESITRKDQAVCTVCHEDLAAVDLESEILRPATDFLTDHPDFKVSIESLSDTGLWGAKRQDLSAVDLKEESNLIFPHDLHMDKNGIDSVDGTVVMACADCHESEKGGLRMLTVTMEKHCASCHQLTFDSESPERVVAHGSPKQLMYDLQGYYAYQFLYRDKRAAVVEAAPAPTPTVQRKARRPGRASHEPKKLITEFVPEKSSTVPMTEQARLYVEKRVTEAAANLFERQTCTICHDISIDNSKDIPWIVKPVRLTGDWFPMADFSHRSHKNMQCDSCHEAEGSGEATDVLMPDIASCQVCHGGEDASDRLQSTCITCHKFHLENQQPMISRIDIDGMDERGIPAEVFGEVHAERSEKSEPDGSEEQEPESENDGSE